MIRFGASSRSSAQLTLAISPHPSTVLSFDLSSAISTISSAQASSDAPAGRDIRSSGAGALIADPCLEAQLGKADLAAGLLSRPSD